MVWDPHRSFAGAATPEWQAPTPAAPPPPAWPGPGAPAPLHMRGEGPGERPPFPSPGHPLGPMRGGYAPPGQLPGVPPGPLSPPLARQGAATPASTSPAGWGDSSFGIPATQAAGLSYCGWWLTGLLFYFGERQNRFVRFHALQSIILTSALTIASVLTYVATSLLNDLYLATHQHVYQTLAIGVALMAFVVIVIPWLFMLGAAFTGRLLRLPFIAPYAERYAPPVPPDYGALDDP